MANIVHFGKYFFPDVGGIETVTLGLAKGAAAAGHSVTVVCFAKDAAKRLEIVDGVNVIRVPSIMNLASQPLSFKYLWCCLDAARKADLVHFHAPNMLGAICTLFISKKVRLLVHWHSDVIDKMFLSNLFRPLEMLLLMRADMVVATSLVYAYASKSLKYFRKKIAVVPIGISDVKFQHEKDSNLTYSLEEITRSNRVILAVGRLVPYKGYDVLIEAAKYLSGQVVVVIVGAGPLEQKLRKIIKNFDLEDRVLLSGRLNDGDLNTLFQRADIYCLSSKTRAEAFGVVLLEAMAYGLPIVASDIPGSGVPWVNKHGLSGLNVPVGDPIALAEAFKKILASEILQNELGNGARQRFLTEFTEAVSVAKILSVYDRLTYATDAVGELD